MKIAFAPILIVFLLFVGCADQEDIKIDSKIDRALPNGTYLVEAYSPGETIPAKTLCAFDDSRPSLSTTSSTSENLTQLTRFGEFVVDNLQIIINESDIQKIWTRTSAVTDVFPAANTMFPNGHAKCTATLDGKIVKNEENFFQESGSYTITWDPVDCGLEVHNYATTGGSVGNGTWIPNAAPAYANTFVDSTETDPQAPWEVYRQTDGYQVKMPASVAILQTQYSCPNNDNSVYMLWKKQ